MVLIEDNTLSVDRKYQRKGIWTKVAINDNEIRICLRENYAVAIVLVSITIICMSFRDVNIALIAICVSFAMAIAKRWTTLQKMYPLRVIRRSKAGTNCGTRDIFDDEISSIVLRENVERDETEDARLLQLYLCFKDHRTPILIYQHYYSENGRRIALDLCRRVDNWLSAIPHQNHSYH